MEYGTYGVIASIASSSIFYPIDTIKTRKQAGLPIAYNMSLYKGLKPEILSSIPSGFTYWYTYYKCREYNLTTTESSFISCLTSNIVDTPFDIKKKKNQLNINTGNIYKYCVGNVMSSLVYNLFYLNTLKYLKDENKFNNVISIWGASTTSAFMSYPFDRWKTSLIYPNKINYFKGLGYRLIHANLYSGLYMTVFLWLCDNKIV